MRYYVILSSVVFLATTLGVVSFVLHSYVIDFSSLACYSSGRASIVLDDAGNELMRFELDRRDPIALNEIPLHVQQAFITSEDRNFFNHCGISWYSIIRSICVNVYRMRRAQGASTITQQLVRLLYLDCKKTFVRKIKEQVCALLVERQFSKEQILQTYLNHVYFGFGVYGIEAAAQRFWGISAKELTVDQGAALAAIVRCPARYNPLVNPEITHRLRDTILLGMTQMGYITQQQCTQARQAPLGVSQKSAAGSFMPHGKEAIRQFVEERVGRHALYTGGLIIQTTINRSFQELASKEFTAQCYKLRQELNRHVDGALITIAVESGEIKALVGGCNFRESQFNRALQARRQMGSVFKPLIYAAALMQGRSFKDTDIDEPAEFINGTNVWRPQNSTGEFEGEMTLARALSLSNNIIAIKTLLRTGIDRVIALAKKCHVTADLPPYASLALGCIDVTTKQVAEVFNIFAHNGVYVEPYLIRWVKDGWGNKIYRHEPFSERVMPARIAGQVNRVLALGIKRYCDRMQVHDLACEAIGKTGTTNDSRTCWFVGSTPRLTTSIYIGSDDNTPLGHNIYPIWTAFPIWLQLHRTLDNARAQFVFDSTLKQITIDAKTGCPVSPENPEALTIYE